MKGDLLLVRYESLNLLSSLKLTVWRVCPKLLLICDLARPPPTFFNKNENNLEITRKSPNIDMGRAITRPNQDLNMGPVRATTLGVRPGVAGSNPAGSTC